MKYINLSGDAKIAGFTVFSNISTKYVKHGIFFDVPCEVLEKSEKIFIPALAVGLDEFLGVPYIQTYDVHTRNHSRIHGMNVIYADIKPMCMPTPQDGVIYVVDHHVFSVLALTRADVATPGRKVYRMPEGEEKRLTYPECTIEETFEGYGELILPCPQKKKKKTS